MKTKLRLSCIPSPVDTTPPESSDRAELGSCRLPDQRAGFSLSELMAVMVLLSMLAAMSVPALRSLSSSENMRSYVGNMTAILNNARIRAVAENTFVYVFFQSEIESREIKLIVLGSRTGLDVFQGSSGTIELDNSSDLALIQPPTAFKLMKLVEKGKVPVSKVARPQPDYMVDLSSEIRVTYRNTTYDHSLVFRPTGEAARPQSDGSAISLAYAGLTEFALEPALPPSEDGSNPLAAVLQLAGSTGQVKVYRAQTAH